MPDMEKVIEGLMCCQYSSKSHCDGCPYCYEGLCETNDCTADLASDALALLKEQEAKEVIESTNMYTGLPITHCPKCGVSIDRYLYGRQHEGQVNYCPYCGQEVKWNA